MSIIEWREDWNNAPKNKIKFLILKKDYDDTPLITTAYFYWYTEDSFLDGQDLAYWALQDAVKDAPLDEDAPAHLQNWKWANFPK